MARGPRAMAIAGWKFHVSDSTGGGSANLDPARSQSPIALARGTPWPAGRAPEVQLLADAQLLYITLSCVRSGSKRDITHTTWLL